MAQEIEDPVAREWFKLALAHGQRKSSFCEITHGTQEHKSWAVYFWELKWQPVTFRMMTPQRSWTAPCRWPNDLPAFQAPERTSKPRPPETQIPRPGPRELDAQFERLGLGHLRPGSRFNLRQPRHGIDERAQAQAVLDRYAAEARQTKQEAAE